MAIPVYILTTFNLGAFISGTLAITLHPDVRSCSAAEYFQISDLSISYTEPHLALDFTAVVARTLRQRPWFAIHMTRPPYHRDVCEDTGKPCAYEMCDIPTPSARLSDDRDICRIDKGRYNISVTLPAPPLIDPRESTKNVYTYTLEFFEQNLPVGCETFVFDALLLKQKDEVRRDTEAEAVNVVTAPTAPTLTENWTSSWRSVHYTMTTIQLSLTSKSQENNIKRQSQQRKGEVR